MKVIIYEKTRDSAVNNNLKKYLKVSYSKK